MATTQVRTVWQRSADGVESQDFWNLVKILVAVWLFVSPWVLGYFTASGAAAAAIGWATSWNSWIASVLIIGAVLAAEDVAGVGDDERGCQVWLQWLHIALGAWLVVTPWTLDAIALTVGVNVNYWAVGGFILVLSLCQLVVLYQGHHKTVERPNKMRVTAYAGDRPRRRD